MRGREFVRLLFQFRPSARHFYMMSTKEYQCRRKQNEYSYAVKERNGYSMGEKSLAPDRPVRSIKWSNIFSTKKKKNEKMVKIFCIFRKVNIQ